MKEEIINRDIINRLNKDLKKNYITAIIGPRQVGKTTAVVLFLDTLIKKRARAKQIRLTLDNLDLLLRLNENPRRLIGEIEDRLGMTLEEYNNKVILFIDEIQRLPDLFLTLKELVDKFKNKLKIYITGSASLDIKKHGAESLAGRLRYRYMHPLTMNEIMSHYGLKTNSVIEYIIKGEDEKKIKEIQAQFLEKHRIIKNILLKRIIYGGLPEAFLTDNEDERFDLFRSYQQTYLEKDVRDLALLHKLGEYQKLIRMLANISAGMFSKISLAENLNISRVTLNNYIRVLIETKVLLLIPPYYTRIIPKLVKSPKAYIFDTGLVNYLLNNKEEYLKSNPEVLGNRLEQYLVTNFYYYATNYALEEEVNFLRSHNNYEIDLFLANKGVAIEVTLSKRIDRKMLKNIIYFSRNLKSLKRGIVFLDIERYEVKNFEGKKWFFVPLWLAF